MLALLAIIVVGAAIFWYDTLYFHEVRSEKSRPQQGGGGGVDDTSGSPSQME